MRGRRCCVWWEGGLDWVVFTSSIAEVGADPVAGVSTAKHNIQGRSVSCSKTVAGQGRGPPAGQCSQELCWQAGSRTW